MAEDPSGAGPTPLHHTLHFDDAEHHYVEVETRVTTGGSETVELGMAVWTPGSYLVREFARHVEDFRAAAPDGHPLAWGKSAKNRWRVEAGGAGEVVVSYRLYCREMTVRTNWVDRSFALLNGAPTFMAPVGADGELEIGRPHVVDVVAPPRWQRVISALPRVSPEARGSGDDGGGAPEARLHRFRAESFDQLVDSPLYLGNGAVHRFEVNGAEHLLVNEGEAAEESVWDGPRSAADVERIVRAHLDLWRVRPYRRYVFFNLLTESRGGLEHKDSTVMMASRWATRNGESYRKWLGLVSHEFFHTWNVKRLRPRALGPFDYEEEVHTESLWIAEGVTSYYDDLLLHRAGLLSREQYLEALSERIEKLQTTPGRLVQRLVDASYDAWIKQYRQDENTVNTAVSYYLKGQMVAWLLDVEIRRRTGDRHSLDDVLRRAWGLYAGERGYAHGELLALASEVAGEDLSAFFHHTLETTEELDYGPALEWLGLRFAGTAQGEGERKDEEEAPSAWLGAETEVRDGRLVITEVRRGTPAFAAGLNVEDEILAFGEYRVPPGELGERLDRYRPGEKVSVLLARREELLRLPVTFGEEPAEDRWKLQPDPEASAEQEAHRARWLGPGPEGTESEGTETSDAVEGDGPG